MNVVEYDYCGETQEIRQFVNKLNDMNFPTEIVMENGPGGGASVIETRYENYEKLVEAIVEIYPDLSKDDVRYWLVI